MLINKNLQREKGEDDLLQKYFEYLQEEKSLIRSLNGNKGNIRRKTRQVRLARLKTILIPELLQKIIELSR